MSSHSTLRSTSPYLEIRRSSRKESKANGLKNVNDSFYIEAANQVRTNTQTPPPYPADPTQSQAIHDRVMRNRNMLQSRREAPKASEAPEVSNSTVEYFKEELKKDDERVRTPFLPPSTSIPSPFNPLTYHLFRCAASWTTTA